jgi:hypothetical protein
MNTTLMRQPLPDRSTLLALSATRAVRSLMFRIFSLEATFIWRLKRSSFADSSKLAAGEISPHFNHRMPYLLRYFNF